MARKTKPGIWVIEQLSGKRWIDFCYLVFLTKREAQGRLKLFVENYPSNEFRLRFYTRTED